MEHEGYNYTNLNSYQRIIKETRGLESWRKNGDYLNYSIIENGQNTVKSLRDLKRLAFTQTLVKNYQLKLMWKPLKE